MPCRRLQEHGRGLQEAWLQSIANAHYLEGIKQERYGGVFSWRLASTEEGGGRSGGV
jgi:hypothetical protein